MTNQILIVGASTRAAAFSALRAGLKPRCIDHFADRDLHVAFPVLRAPHGDGAAGLEAAARGSSGEPWFYTGPLENHPDLVGRISRSHRLLGNSPEILRAVRDPLRLAAVLRRRGLPCPDVRGSPEGLSPRRNLAGEAGRLGRGATDSTARTSKEILIRTDLLSEVDRRRKLLGALHRQRTRGVADRSDASADRGAWVSICLSRIDRAVTVSDGLKARLDLTGQFSPRSSRSSGCSGSITS